jgi:anti-sigma factor RsiW
MRSQRIDEMLLVRYLLGELPEEEQVQVEDRAFSDPEYLGALEAAEADLIDAWVRGELPAAQRRGFENRFLTSPQRRQKVEFARALAGVVAASAAAESTATAQIGGRPSIADLFRGWNFGVRLAASMALVVMLAGAVWIGYLAAGRRGAVEPAQALSHPGSAAPTGNIPSLILLPGLSRAQTRVEQLRLEASAQVVRVRIQLEARDDYPLYRADLRTRAGAGILTLANLTRSRTADAYAVSFDVPASSLTSGNYELALQGLTSGGQSQDIGFYYFSVEKP